MKPSRAFSLKRVRLLPWYLTLGIFLAVGAMGCGMRTPMGDDLDEEEWGAWDGGGLRTGGNKATGGMTRSGGYTQNGGAKVSTGGTKALGGVMTTGGITARVGGSMVRGGTPATGGTTARAGGAMVRGGTPATGGTQIRSGGSPARNGGARFTTGGAVGRGGAIVSGGTPSVGGAVVAMGGVTATGGKCSLIDPLLEETIDDMNDKNRFIPSIQGRSGAWSCSHDGSPGVSMFPDPADGFVMSDTGDECHQYGAFVKGSGAVLGGSSMRFGLGSPYNASRYEGISFWAKSDSGTNQVVRVAFPDKDTIPDGGLCQTSVTSGPTACWDHFGYRLTITTTWTKYIIRWSQLTQDGWAKKDAFDASAIYQIMFQIPEAANYAFWIDDVAFRHHSLLLP